MNVIFFKADISGLGSMFVAWVYRPSITPLVVFTQLFIKTLESTDICRTMFSGDFKIYVSMDYNGTRNYVDTFF